MSYDIIIVNGRIIDGAGNPWYKADVGVKGDHISFIGDLKEAEAERKIDASNLIVSPGFIDIHSHSDIPLLVDPKAQSKIRQGVTTEVIGNCGNSAAPMNEELKKYRDEYRRSSVPDDFEYDWRTVRDYFDRLESTGTSVNIVAFVGHGTIRHNVMGYENRKPTSQELDEMQDLVAEAMKDGVFGMSTGLIYPPSVYGDTEEIIELAKIVSEHNGIYASHIRGEGDTLLEAVKEACIVGKQANTPVHIAHFKASGKQNWGKTKESLALLEQYRLKGVDVTFDQYPYIASSTGLTALLPHWAHEGGAVKLLERLKDPEIRTRMKNERRLGYDWDGVIVVFAKNNSQYNGKNIAEISEEMNKDPFDTICDLLILENTQVPSVMFGMSEEDVRRVMQSRYGMIGSDGSAISPEGILGEGRPHPRFYGTFPRVIGHYVREGVLTLQEAVRKMTSAPAQRLKIWDRGLIKEKYKADITLFNPKTVKDEATFTDPHRYASGIPYVIVDGEIVILNGEHTGKLPGGPIRRK